MRDISMTGYPNIYRRCGCTDLSTQRQRLPAARRRPWRRGRCGSGSAHGAGSLLTASRWTVLRAWASMPTNTTSRFVTEWSSTRDGYRKDPGGAAAYADRRDRRRVRPAVADVKRGAGAASPGPRRVRAVDTGRL